MQIGSKLVLASHNDHKIAEMKLLLAPLDLEVLSVKELEISTVEETGNTFEDNAAIKAEHGFAETNMPTLADDSGLVIPALGGMPGVDTNPWAMEQGGYPQAFAKLEELLQGKDHACYFICMMALKLPGQDVQFYEGRIDGHLSFPPRGKVGFGYDPIFVPEGYDQTYAELSETSKIKLAHSHRSRAIEAIVKACQQKAS
ncbi:MAG: non-canonical purine NTP pyrophosphatase [Alphaproteobacteria bacterium]